MNALESCARQTYFNIEIIVIDDGSSDSTLDLVRDFSFANPALRIKILTHKLNLNKGVAASRLLGFENSCGQFISLLDSDDQYEPNHIETQIACLSANPHVVMCHTAIRIVGDRSSASAHERHFSSSPLQPYRLSDLEDFMFRLHICNSSAMIRASALTNIVYPSRMLYQKEDWLLWVLLSRKGPFIQLPGRTVLFLKHNSSYTGMLSMLPLKERYARLEFLVLVCLLVPPSLLTIKCTLLILRTFARLRGK